MKLAKSVLTLCEDVVVKIASKKFADYQKLAIQTAVEFYLAEMGVKESGIVISLAALGKGKAFGDVTLNDDTIKRKKFTMKLNPDVFFELMLRNVAHETVHIKQIIKGELKANPDMTHIMWKDEPIISAADYNDIQYPEYIKLPFEAEAISMAVTLRDKFLKSKEFQGMKGKHPTLDLIIRDIK